MVPIAASVTTPVKCVRCRTCSWRLRQALTSDPSLSEGLKNRFTSFSTKFGCPEGDGSLCEWINPRRRRARIVLEHQIPKPHASQPISEPAIEARMGDGESLR